MQKVRDPKFLNRFVESCREGFQDATQRAETDSQSPQPQRIETSVDNITDIITNAAETCFGSLKILRHSRTHKYDKRIAKKRKQLNNYRRNHWKQSLDKTSEVYAAVKRMKKELKKLQDENTRRHARLLSQKVIEALKIGERGKVYKLIEGMSHPMIT